MESKTFTSGQAVLVALGNTLREAIFQGYEEELVRVELPAQDLEDGDGHLMVIAAEMVQPK